jgi:hypothetical protein
MSGTRTASRRPQRKCPATHVGGPLISSSRRHWDGETIGAAPPTDPARAHACSVVQRRHQGCIAKSPGARSALGPCRNGRARAAAVTNGRQRFGRTAGHRPSSSGSWDAACNRFRLWSRTSYQQGAAACELEGSVHSAAECRVVVLTSVERTDCQPSPGIGVGVPDVVPQARPQSAHYRQGAGPRPLVLGEHADRLPEQTQRATQGCQAGTAPTRRAAWKGPCQAHDVELRSPPSAAVPLAEGR